MVKKKRPKATRRRSKTVKKQRKAAKTRAKATPHAKRRSAQKKQVRSPAHERFEHAPLPNVAVPEWLVKDILAKRDLLASPDLATHVVLRFLRKNPSLVPQIGHESFKRTAAYEKLKKWVRQELRVLVGMFILETHPAKLLDADRDTILKSHRSTVERFAYYPGLYDELFGEQKPAVILDLCCGLNPVSYGYLGCTPVYYAIDISPQLMDFVNEWFLANGITGRAECRDVTAMQSFPDADTVFLFKAMDVLERLRYGYGEHLLDVFKDKRVIVSFARATIGGKRAIKDSKRAWIERWAQANMRSVRVVERPNELFYVIS